MALDYQSYQYHIPQPIPYWTLDSTLLHTEKWSRAASHPLKHVRWQIEVNGRQLTAPSSRFCRLRYAPPSSLPPSAGGLCTLSGASQSHYSRRWRPRASSHRPGLLVLRGNGWEDWSQRRRPRQWPGTQLGARRNGAGASAAACLTSHHSKTLALVPCGNACGRLVVHAQVHLSWLSGPLGGFLLAGRRK
jgi:hypothetical protein